jgi:hypothetical protein
MNQGGPKMPSGEQTPHPLEIYRGKVAVDYFFSISEQGRKDIDSILNDNDIDPTALGRISSGLAQDVIEKMREYLAETDQIEKKKMSKRLASFIYDAIEVTY